MARNSRKPVNVLTLMQQNSVLRGQLGEPDTANFSQPSQAQPLNQTQIVRQLNTELMQFLQLENLLFCRVSRIKQGRVLIMCSTGSWATRLKMHSSNLLSRFRQQGFPSCAGIDIEVNPNLNIAYQQTPPTESKELPQISEQAATYLLALAQNSDPLLASRLQKLAALATNKTTVKKS